MRGLDYQQFVYKPVRNNFITDQEIQEGLKNLKINQYTSLERFHNQILIVFKLPGDRFICLSDLINLKEYQQGFFNLEYAIIIINSILIEFQNIYETIKQNVSFDVEEIWIGNQQKSPTQVEVIFTFNFEKQQNYNPNIQQLIQTIKKIFDLFSQTDSKRIQIINEKFKECNNFHLIQNLIQKILTPNSQLNIDLNIVQVYQNLINVFNQKNEIQLSLNEQNYTVLKSNIINWVIKCNNRFNQNFTIKDIFYNLNLQDSYKIFTQWSDSDYIFNILKENEILNQLQSLQNIKDIIFLLAFPKYRLDLNDIPPQFYGYQTQVWIQQVEQIINYKIQHYIKNLSDFYKIDKEDSMNIDFKCIFNKVKESFNETLQQCKNIEIIKNNEFIQQTTLGIIKIYYEEKVQDLNKELIKIIFQQK